MAKLVLRMVLLFLFVVVSNADRLQSSQAQTLLRIKLFLNSPSYLEPWNSHTDFCNTEPTEKLTVVCYERSVTQLHIAGDLGTLRLPENFSVESFFTTLANLRSLKVLTLSSLGLWGALPTEFTKLSSLEIVNLTSNFLQGEIPMNISSLESLETLILGNNNFTGVIPDGIGFLSELSVLDLRNNSLHGSLPRSIGNLASLRVLDLSGNNFSGEVPDFSRLTNLQVLNLGNNNLGSRFPVIGDKIEAIVLRNNRFTFGIPGRVGSCYHLKTLDISSNRFVGPFPVAVLSLPSIGFLDISENKFTGMLSENLACGDELYFANFTDNLLTGKLPRCLSSDPKKLVAEYDGNCLETGDGNQSPVSFCRNAALAVGVGIVARPGKRKHNSKVILGLSVVGGVVGGLVLVGAVFFAVKNISGGRERRRNHPPAENAPTTYTSKILKDARYITQAMKVGALGLPVYRTFSPEELEEATSNFDTSSFMGEGSHGQMYRGKLRDGSFAAIRWLKPRRYHSTRLEMVSKLRHHHLVSALGHCFEYEESSITRVFLVFEYVPNGTLRSWISERGRRKLTWPQRIAAAIGVAKGIQFLHTGIVPGLFANNIKITDVLMDQHLVAKISSYNLPLLSDMGKHHLQNYLGGSKEFKRARAKHQDKLDIHDFGVILLEVITGKAINSRNDMETVKYQLQASLIADDVSRKSLLIDPAVKNSCSVESMKTMMEICCRCLHESPGERPSIEDVIWNLQFAAQVQDMSQSSDGSPISPLQASRLKLTIR